MNLETKIAITIICLLLIGAAVIWTKMGFIWRDVMISKNEREMKKLDEALKKVTEDLNKK